MRTHFSGPIDSEAGYEFNGEPVKTYFTVQAHKATVGAGQTNVEVFEFKAPVALTLAGVQAYCTAVTGTATIDVKEGTASVLHAAVTLAAGNVVAGTVDDPAIAKDAALTVLVTTAADTGAITDLTVTLIFKTALTV